MLNEIPKIKLGLSSRLRNEMKWEPDTRLEGENVLQIPSYTKTAATTTNCQRLTKQLQRERSAIAAAVADID